MPVFFEVLFDGMIQPVPDQEWEARRRKKFMTLYIFAVDKLWLQFSVKIIIKLVGGIVIQHPLHYLVGDCANGLHAVMEHMARIESNPHVEGRFNRKLKETSDPPPPERGI